MNTAGSARKEATNGDDRPLADANAARQAIQPAMVEIMSNINRFGSRKAASSKTNHPG